MKKVFCAVLVMGLMSLAGVASALDPVTFDAGCPMWSGDEDPVGFEAAAVAYLWAGVGVWHAVGLDEVAGFPASWAACDLEGLVGDGLADRLQLALLAASLCSGDPLVTGQYEDNLAGFMTIMDDFNELIAAADPVGTDLATHAPMVEALAVTLDGYCTGMGEPYCTYAAQFHAMAVGMDAASVGLADFVGRFSTYVPIFAELGPWFVGMAGTSAAMDATIEGLMFNEDYGIVKDLPPAAEGFATLAGYLHGAAAALPGLGQAELAALLEADADGLDGLVIIIGGLAWPEIAIYGVVPGPGKTLTEPFSGAGDYDGNYDINSSVAAKVGSDPAAFVAAASGFYVWYSGNPALPVAGILGLALLAGACVMGGAASIRRK